MPPKTIKLNNGQSIPLIGFGTWKIPQETCTDNVELAIELGFNHIDTAQAYRNQTETGKAIRESGLKRDDIWVTTKWSGSPWGTPSLSPSESIKDSLTQLGLSALDLYLIHTPRLVREKGLRKGYNEVAELQKQGLTKSVGVSNFTLEDMKELLEGEKKVEIVPAINQIELHPYNYHEQYPLINYCQANHIVIEAYSPLKPLTTYPDGPLSKPLNAIAKRLNVPAEAVLLAWVRQKGCVALTTSRTKERLQTYLKSTELELSYDDIIALEKEGRKDPRSVKRKVMDLSLAKKVMLAVVFMIQMIVFYVVLFR